MFLEKIVNFDRYNSEKDFTFADDCPHDWIYRHIPDVYGVSTMELTANPAPSHLNQGRWSPI